MSQNISTEWSKTEQIVFRLAFCYLTLYFLFLDNTLVYNFPFLEYVHAPFQYISDVFVGFVNRFLIHRKYAANIYKGLGDTSWFYIAIFSFFIIAFLATILWTIFDKRKKHPLLLACLHTYSRYYLAINLIFYGNAKLFGTQFVDPLPNYLIQPVGNIDPHMMLWTFMGASKAYNFFGGMLEIIAAALLFFRKTATLGALIAIATLINVLALNIGYDTPVKILSFHLILAGLFIICPDVKRLLNFFLRNRDTSLAIAPNLIVNNRFRRMRYGIKFVLIGYVAFTSIKLYVGLAKDYYSNPYFGGIAGIYDIKKFYWNNQILTPIITDTLCWKKIAINKFGDVAVQYVNDSFADYGMKADIIRRSVTLSKWNDTAFKCNLHYTISNPDEYVFEGSYKSDSIRFISRKIDLKSLPLLKDRGKVIWFWW